MFEPVTESESAAGCHAVVRVLSPRVPGPREEAAVLTVLQTDAEHRALQAWCSGVGVAVGGQPTPQEVLQALVQRLLVDPALAADVAADLREGADAADVAGYVGW